MSRPTGVSVTTVMMCATNALGFFYVNWTRPHAMFTFVVFAILIGIGYLVLWFFWNGRNWARWLVLLTSLLALWNLHYIGRPQIGRIRTVTILFEAPIAVFLLWYLNLRPIRAWFRRQK